MQGLEGAKRGERSNRTKATPLRVPPSIPGRKVDHCRPLECRIRRTVSPRSAWTGPHTKPPVNLNEVSYLGNLTTTYIYWEATNVRTQKESEILEEDPNPSKRI
jgi:hypothetical protein